MRPAAGQGKTDVRVYVTCGQDVKPGVESTAAPEYLAAAHGTSNRACRPVSSGNVRTPATRGGWSQALSLNWRRATLIAASTAPDGPATQIGQK